AAVDQIHAAADQIHADVDRTFAFHYPIVSRSFTSVQKWWFWAWLRSGDGLDDDLELFCDLACQAHFAPIPCRKHLASPVDGGGGPKRVPRGGHKEVRVLMSRYHSFRRIAALVACVGSTSAIAALAGASPAVAAECQKGPLYASGSSFQNTAQNDFKANWEKFSKCIEKPTSSTITYTATSSGKGMEVFGAGNLSGEHATELLNRKDTTVKSLEEKAEACEPKIKKAAAVFEPSGKCLDLFIGTDDAPTAKQLE